MGASTCMFKQLNSRANTGFDNITETQRFSSRFSMVSTAVVDSMELGIWCLEELSFSFSVPGEEGLDTLAGFTALTLYDNSFIQKKKQTKESITCSN